MGGHPHPPPSRHAENEWKGDTPLAFGLHPNAEIGYFSAAEGIVGQTLVIDGGARIVD